MSFGFSIATDRCYGCKTCSVACAIERQAPAGILFRRVRQLNNPDPVGSAFVSMACNHCDDPACLTNCPVQAYTKLDNGLVVQDHSLCIGCQTCVQACPFHAPSYCEDDSTTYKCDGCYQRQENGQQPICVAACPMAIVRSFEDFDGYAESAQGAVSIKDAAPTKPNLLASLDPDLPLEAFADIDGWAETVDRGGEGY